MCYTKPGPRCSGHARTTLDNARAALEAAEEQRRAQSRLVQSMTLEERRPLLDDPNGPYKAARRAVAQAEEALIVAENEYAATPAGMADLKQEMADLEEQWGRVQARTSVGYTELAKRLERAQQTRRDQMEAYKAIHGATRPSAGEVDSAEDEEAAMAPPPACTCITYKYKGDCEHATPQISDTEADQARREMLPTTEEASLRLHAANSRLRAMQADLAKWQAWLNEDPNRTVNLPGLGAMVTRQAREENPEFAAFDAEWTATAQEAQDAEKAFYKTPGGQAHLRQKAAEITAQMGYETGESQDYFTRAIESDEDRDAARTAYALQTGRPAPAEETDPTPPTLTYSNGCPDNCRDFAWTGKCADVDPALRQQRMMRDALVGDPQLRKAGKAMATAMDKAFSPKPRSGRLARLLGRGKAPAKPEAEGMSAAERTERLARLEYRIRKAEDALDHDTVRRLRAESDQLYRQRAS